MITFQPESHVAFCKTLGGAQEFASFLKTKFTGNPQIVQNITFLPFIESNGKVSVHANIPVNQVGHELFREAIAEFKTQWARAA